MPAQSTHATTLTGSCGGAGVTEWKWDNFISLGLGLRGGEMCKQKQPKVPCNLREGLCFRGQQELQHPSPDTKQRVPP